MLGWKGWESCQPYFKFFMFFAPKAVTLQYTQQLDRSMDCTVLYHHATPALVYLQNYGIIEAFYFLSKDPI